MSIEVTIICAIIGSNALTAVIGYFLNRQQKKHDKESGTEAGVRILLYDKIKYLGNKYINRGSMTADEYEDLKVMHEVYHNQLNGNGYLDDVMGKVRELYGRARP